MACRFQTLAVTSLVMGLKAAFMLAGTVTTIFPSVEVVPATSVAPASPKSTVLLVPKPAPLIVTVLPTTPWLGDNERMLAPDSTGMVGSTGGVVVVGSTGGVVVVGSTGGVVAVVVGSTGGVVAVVVGSTGGVVAVVVGSTGGVVVVGSTGGVVVVGSTGGVVADVVGSTGGVVVVVVGAAATVML
jgi:hypothetical protein